MAWAWAYLAVSLVGAAFVVNAYVPQRRGPQTVVSFFAGWLTGEFPIHHLVWQAAATAVFAAFGAFDSWPGWVGLAVTVLAWVGLVGLARIGRDAGRIVTRALDGIAAPEPPPAPALDDRAAPPATAAPVGGAPLPADPAVTVEAAPDAPSLVKVAAALGIPASGRDTLWRAARLVNPFPKPVPGMEIIHHIDYAGDGRKTHRLDIIRRRVDPPAAGAPVLVYVHGGAWIIGDKRQQGLPMLFELARRGWVCVTINYGLSPKVVWPEHIVDCKRALAWTRDHVADYGGDPGFIAVSGGSAGGHLSALLALTADDPDFQPGFEDADTSVQACVPFYGVYDMTCGLLPGDKRRMGDYASGMVRMLERMVFKKTFDDNYDLYAAASPLHRVHADAPPFFVLHGTNDTLVPVAEGRTFVAALRAVSTSPVAYAELPRTQHAFDVMPSVRCAHAVAGAVRFLEGTRVPAPQPA